MNFIEDNEINLPYFLLNSLRNTSGNVQRKIQFIENTMYHHGLIKILVEYQLKNVGDNWEILWGGTILKKITKNNQATIRQREGEKEKLKNQ